MARTRNRMRHIDRHAEMGRLDVGRSAAIALGGLYGGPDYAAARRIVEAIDDFAERETGDRKYFHTKMANDPLSPYDRGKQES